MRALVLLAGAIAAVLSGCGGFTCETACIDTVGLVWSPGVALESGTDTCSQPAIVEADNCNACDLALVAELGDRFTGSTCSGDAEVDGTVEVD